MWKGNDIHQMQCVQWPSIGMASAQLNIIFVAASFGFYLIIILSANNCFLHSQLTSHRQDGFCHMCTNRRKTYINCERSRKRENEFRLLITDENIEKRIVLEAIFISV